MVAVLQRSVCCASHLLATILIFLICLQLFKPIPKAISQSTFKLGQVAKPFRLQFIKKYGSIQSYTSVYKCKEVYKCKLKGIQFLCI